MSTTDAPRRSEDETPRVALAPLADTSTFAERAYVALKDVILSLNVYERAGDVRKPRRSAAAKCRGQDQE